MTQVGGIPTSRAYWELKAEQVMNRVFAPAPSIDLEIIDAGPARPPAPEPAPAPSQHPNPRPSRVPARLGLGPSDRGLLVGGLVLMGVVLTGTSLLGLGFWGQYQQALQQERNMLLIERLRNLSPAGVASAPPKPTQAAAATGGPSNAAAELPPPPPDEPWMQELASLPNGSALPARVLQVPLSDRLGAPAPPASTSAARSAGGAGAGLPQLVGVIQIPGRGSSAIFQLDGSSTSAGVGESIGSSGWRLRSAGGDTAVIERGGEQRRLSISSGF